MKIILNRKQQTLLMEALRRYIKFNDAKRSIDTAWTGLGNKSTYRPVLDSGMMTWVNGEPYPRTMGWLSLTELGSKIVKTWIELGYNELKFYPGEWEYPVNSNGDKPPFEIEIN